MYAVHIPPESAPKMDMEVTHHPGVRYKAPWADAEPYKPQQQQQQQPKKDEGKEESLTTLLDENQRGELTLLIASAMSAMRKSINLNYDVNVGTKLPPIAVPETDDF